MVKVLFVNQQYSQCGVYQFGYNTSLALYSFKNIHEFAYCEASCKEEYDNAYKAHNPDVVIFNHHPSTMMWLNSRITRELKCALIMHDQPIRMQRALTIYPDPTFTAKDNIFPVGRPLLQGSSVKLAEKVLPNTIGTFGFGFSQKGYVDILKLIKREFGKATFRAHIPYNTFADSDGNIAKEMVGKIQSVEHEGIDIQITHDYKSPEELLYWLSENTINVFMYNNSLSMGVSSVTDWALSAKRPIAVNSDKMFRHLPAEINVNNSSLTTIINKGISPLIPLYEAWSNENLYKQYCGVVDEIIRASGEH